MQSLGTGGSERLVLDIARSIDRRRFFPVVGSLSGGSLELEFQKLGIPTVVFGKGPGFDISLIARIARFLRQDAIDLVNVHHFSPLFYHFLAGRFCPRVRTVHTQHSSIDFVPERFLGPRMDVPRLMKILDLYCLPSSIEGLPLSLLEAMGCGVCSVANVPGNKEVIRDRENGVLVPPGNPDALSSAITGLLKNGKTRERLGEEGKDGKGTLR